MITVDTGLRRYDNALSCPDVSCVFACKQALGTLYVGVTSDLVSGLFEHESKAVLGFTARYDVGTLVWFEAHDSIEAAIRRE